MNRSANNTQALLLLLAARRINVGPIYWAISTLMIVQLLALAMVVFVTTGLTY